MGAMPHFSLIAGAPGPHSPPAEWRGGAPQPSGSFPLVFVLAESCLRIFEACSVKAELEESGRRITEEGERRGLRKREEGREDAVSGKPVLSLVHGVRGSQHHQSNHRVVPS